MLQDVSRIRKYGDSIGVRIPKKIWDFLGWREMDVVSVLGDRNKIIITRIPLEKFRDTSLSVGGEEA